MSAAPTSTVVARPRRSTIWAPLTAAGDLRAGGLALRGVHIGMDVLEVALLLVGRAHLAHALECLLDVLRGGKAAHARGLHHGLERAPRAEEDGEPHRTAPERREREPPVKGEQANGCHGERYVGAVELGQHVAVGVLGGLDVGHEGLGEVGEVAAAEEAQGQLAQALGEADALPAALLVDDAVLVVVGPVLRRRARRQRR